MRPLYHNSVIVSATEYDDSNALYCMDDQPCSTQNNLKLGMVVQVNGTAQSLPDGSLKRVADMVRFQQTAAGVVQSVAADGSGLVVLGQFRHGKSKDHRTSSPPSFDPARLAWQVFPEC